MAESIIPDLTLPSPMISEETTPRVGNRFPGPAVDIAMANLSRTPEAERMARLLQEFEKGDDQVEDSMSTDQAARMISLQIALESNEVVDLGEGERRRFALEKKLLARVDRVVGELQYFLQRAAALVPGRRKHFKIDPEDNIIPLLSGCNTTAQLVAAWEIVRSRIDLGRKFVSKYAKEFANPDAIQVFSPMSTDSQVSEEGKIISSPNGRLRHMIAYYPHHNEFVRGSDAQHEVMTGSWERVIEIASGSKESQEKEREEYSILDDETRLKSFVDEPMEEYDTAPQDLFSPMGEKTYPPRGVESMLFPHSITVPPVLIHGGTNSREHTHEYYPT
ncbi:hypothetical protein B0H12DRAFT_1071984 [Mycena haematopus]|nr:hypothetical protein B0H12DRAFT_1071984 [Mycena haematopus]